MSPPESPIETVAIPGLPAPDGLNQAAVDRVVSRVDCLQHAKGHGAGERFNLRPWQTAILAELFGRLRPDGRRQYRTCYLEIPRKNGKSELAAAIALYMLMGDGEMGAEVIGAAAEREQASLVFNAAAHMVRTNPTLDAQCKVIQSTRRIVHYATGSFYKAISAEAYSKHGFNASAIIYDELHAAPNRELWDVLTTSIGARAQPLIFVITTAGWDRSSICWELHEYAVKVRDGVVDDPTFLPVLFTAGEDEDWEDEAVWRRCNPALGDFRSLEEMRDKAREAKAKPAYQNTFRRLYLNQWTQQDTRAIDMKLWQLCQTPPEVPRGTPCYAGLDLGLSDDFSSHVLVWPLEGGQVVCDAMFWIPEAALEKYPNRPYDAWRRAGVLEVTEGNMTDYPTVEAAVLARCQQHGVRELAYDKRFAQQMAQNLEGAGVTVVDQPQGFQLNEACMRLFELIAEGDLCHGQHPVLSWMASNVVVRHDREQRVRPDKDRAGEKIDGVVALLMAVAAWLRAPVESDFEVREVRALSW